MTRSRKVKINGVTWTYTAESVNSWEMWELTVNKLLLRIQKIYPETKLAPENFDRSEWTRGYELTLDFDDLCPPLPLDTPLEEVLARAIVEARMK